MNFVNALNALRITVYVAVGILIVLRILSRWLAQRFSEDTPLMQLVGAANALKSNIWAIVIIAMGGLLICCGDKEDGRVLVTGGFAIFQREQGAGSPLAPSPLAVNPAPKS